MRSACRPPRLILSACAVVFLIVSTGGFAAETRLFRMQSRKAFLQGTLDGIGVDSLGTLQLADRVERLAEVGEPFLLAAAPHPDGWVVGTGNAGRVLLVERSGEVRTLFAADEPEIFAVWADRDGTVFAGSSPLGKVYRVSGDEVSVFFDPGETYIWQLARGSDGDLLVATGTEGRLFSVDATGQGSVVFDSEDTHLRAMKVLSGGEILLGTAGEGLILKLGVDGNPQTLYDAPHPEVVALAADPDGSCYAALLASEASQVTLERRTQDPEQQEEEPEDEGDDDGIEQPQVTVTVTSEPAGEVSVGSRPPGFGGPRAEILRISQQGAVETVATFQTETVYSMIWQRERLWIGTGLEGKVYSLRGQSPVLEKDVDERQVVALVDDEPGPAFATTNAAAFYRITGGTERSGSYTSPALDAQQIARFGNLRWEGRVPGGAKLQFSFRSGMSSEPDRTWTAWSTPSSDREVSLGNLPSGRFIQWQARFEAADGASPSLSEVTVSYRQANLPPHIESLAVMNPGEILVPANFNPSQQAYEPAHPNRQGIFSTIKPAKPAEGRRTKTLWKRGFRTLKWEAEDPNKDSLHFSLAFRPDLEGSDWLTVVDDLAEDYYSFNATVLPDGRYRFRLQAADRERADDAERKVAIEYSEPVLIDHTVPTLGRVSASDSSLAVIVEDRWSPLREAEYSFDAGEWRPALPSDGLLDGQRETLQLAVPSQPGLLLLRVVDAAFNVVTFDLSQETAP